ncbi:hypothetical protein POVCU2_0042050 [Plasmodium ovale curtisi]|uniref:Uncharacterized protein n=1 Tax=Plasmodium ovale curtisi TaxID=864141 RepID=A0A1A8WYU3_PLAOA|nr:hypothetical protein POVCU2_0042050 [Plasmodium ovale curtisi]SBS97518.1 hypothetical protein POVCU1_038840 [Plasmodium ovale curtisi]
MGAFEMDQAFCQKKAKNAYIEERKGQAKVHNTLHKLSIAPFPFLNLERVAIFVNYFAPELHHDDTTLERKFPDLAMFIRESMSQGDNTFS